MGNSPVHLTASPISAFLQDLLWYCHSQHFSGIFVCILVSVLELKSLNLMWCWIVHMTVLLGPHNMTIMIVLTIQMTLGLRRTGRIYPQTDRYMADLGLALRPLTLQVDLLKFFLEDDGEWSILSLQHVGVNFGGPRIWK